MLPWGAPRVHWANKVTAASLGQSLLRAPLRWQLLTRVRTTGTRDRRVPGSRCSPRLREASALPERPSGTVPMCSEGSPPRMEPSCF